jgi:hypothetical protein
MRLDARAMLTIIGRRRRAAPERREHNAAEQKNQHVLHEKLLKNEVTAEQTVCSVR